jgi:hypothetical protein
VNPLLKPKKYLTNKNLNIEVSCLSNVFKITRSTCTENAQSSKHFLLKHSSGATAYPKYPVTHQAGVQSITTEAEAFSLSVAKIPSRHVHPRPIRQASVSRSLKRNASKSN